VKQGLVFFTTVVIVMEKCQSSKLQVLSGFGNEELAFVCANRAPPLKTG
jgi:hypothetical protein